MFFKSYAKLADKTVADMDKIGEGVHKTLAAKDTLLDLNTATAGELHKKYEKADTLRARAWGVWTVSGLANLFIASAAVSGVLGLVTLVACGITCYKWLQCRAMDKSLKRMNDAYEDNKEKIYGSHHDYRRALAEEQWALERAKKQQQPVAGDFNTAATDIDLDNDITVSRPLKFKTPAVAA